ncbi:hypothetical protein JNB91_08960 [Rhizobium wenxiniae]|uniref:hypothetical protein n=1 Tax=Rhizobium wenxiniae TaxID=1737357 RepID=UPI001C6E2950|nr:hypothetical protein [Rhizobium wenxiniae]MBW9087972.1 hypothetical protein [Rhizobium wenxiniae]
MVISDFCLAFRITQESAELKTICVAYYRFPAFKKTQLQVKRWWMSEAANRSRRAKNVFLMKARVRQMRQRQFFPHVSQKYKKRG